jgi:hypothetical protein
VAHPQEVANLQHASRFCGLSTAQKRPNSRYHAAMTRASRGPAVIVAALLTASSCAAVPPPELAVLDREARGTDVLPAEAEIPEEISKFRYVGDSATSAVFAARGSDEQPWCVLILGGQAPGKVVSWSTASSCADDDRFARSGVEVSMVGTDGQHAAARLLPDGFVGELEDGWELTAPNLAVPVE